MNDKNNEHSQEDVAASVSPIGVANSRHCRPLRFAAWVPRVRCRRLLFGSR